MELLQPTQDLSVSILVSACTYTKVWSHMTNRAVVNYGHHDRIINSVSDSGKSAQSYSMYKDQKCQVPSGI